jgi:hypothetical protein
MRRAAAVLLLLVSACTGTPGTGPSPAPTATAGTPAPTAADLTGRWLVGTAGEPPAGPVAQCQASTVWNLVQTGEAVKGDVDYCAGPCLADTEGTTGTNRAGRVVLSGTYRGGGSPEPVAYDLTFDAASGHLRGTRNGAPFWAAPYRQLTDGCGPVVL